VLEKAAVLSSSDTVGVEFYRVLIPELCYVLIIALENGLDFDVKATQLPSTA